MPSDDATAVTRPAAAASSAGSQRERRRFGLLDASASSVVVVVATSAVDAAPPPGGAGGGGTAESLGPHRFPRAARRSAEVAMSSAICGLIAERRDARIELDRCGRDEAKRAREKSERLSSV